MTRLLAFAGVAILAVSCVGQDAAPAPQFLASDVHVVPRTSDTDFNSGLRGTQFEMRNTTLLAIIQRAYAIPTDRGTNQLDADKIIGGPRWLELSKFTVVAKTPPGTKLAETLPMLKALLAERFGLVAHEDKRPLPAYVLSLGKGKHKLKPAEGGEPRCGSQGTSPDRRYVQHLMCRGYPISTFADMLRNFGITGRVENQTGLEGTWDIDLEFTPQQTMAQAGPEGISIFDAIDKQLGLKLEMQRLPQTVLVIDSVNETPTANVPGVEVKMDPAPPPPTVEVATIKPSAPGTTGGGISIRSNQGTGQIDIRGMNVSRLIQQAWDLTPDRVVGLPAGIDDHNYDIVAKLQMGATQGFSFTIIRPILQGLLNERFNLKARLEDRPVDAYKLVAVKPKMAAADPANRGACKDGPAPDAKDPREKIPSRSRLYTCQNVTMTEFTERLQSIGQGYLRTPVVNATKLGGLWDFTLNFSPAPPVNNPNGIPAPVAQGAAADPTETLSLFDAITSQLGLKLEAEKRMLPVLVIDHIDDMPTDN